jgi:putative transposase
MSASTVGRILARLVARGAIVPVARAAPASRRTAHPLHREAALRPPPAQGPQGPGRPGELVQIDALFVNVRPGCADQALHRLRSRRPSGRIGRVATLGASAASAAALLEKLDRRSAVPRARRPGRRRIASSWRPSNRPAATTASNFASCRPSAPTSTDASNAPSRSWRYEFYAAHDLPHRLDKLQEPSSTPSPIASTTTGPHRRPWRNDPRRLSQIHQRRRPPAVSYVLNPDTS